MLEKRVSNQVKFNLFSFISTFARSLIEIFISLYLFNNGFSLQMILIFYLFQNLFSIPLSYLFVRIGEKYNYLYGLLAGIVSFVLLQGVLKKLVVSLSYIIVIAFLYSVYKRGYWVSRRFYLTEIIPTKQSSKMYSFVLIISELSSIFAGYAGALFLSCFDMSLLIIVSSLLLLVSMIPLVGIKYKSKKVKIDLLNNLKKYNKLNFLVFSFYEITDLLNFIFPIYIAMYIKESYMMAGSLNAINNIAIVLFIFIYGKLINKKNNYLILSSFLVIIVCLLKINVFNYLIVLIYFIEGIVKKMQSQSVNKIYFENRGEMDITHYNLIYQMLESVARALAVIPLLFLNNIKVMICFVLIIISVEMGLYMVIKTKYKNN